MASYREHVTFSSLLGVGYGALAVFGAGYTPQQGLLAGCLAGIGGMLPDLDLPTGKPGKEIFSLTAAVAPLILVGRVLKAFQLPNDAETTMLCVVVMYLAIRYGMAALVARFSSHRGMFHSIPALIIAGELVYLGYPSGLTTVKLLMGGGVAIGFLSHLILDEIWSIRWNGVVPDLKKSSGTAMKFVGEKFVPNALTFAILATASFFVLDEAGLLTRPGDASSNMAEESAPQEATSDAPLLRQATLPEEFLDAPATSLGAPHAEMQTPDVLLPTETELGAPSPSTPPLFQPTPATRPVPAPTTIPEPTPSLENVFSVPRPSRTVEQPAPIAPEPMPQQTIVPMQIPMNGGSPDLRQL
ncbi:MAG: metal-dependent hydrolase [Planctomycetaceae bacterium]|nr:metal-dependent hydrolase [Planctomycetaceae bacterium]MCB9951193.1 metal-dependent hydrolase [Planctomycetaceae bacterium]